MPRYYAIDKAFVSDGSATISRGRCKPTEGSELIMFERTRDDVIFVARAKVNSISYEDLGDGRKRPESISLGEQTDIGGERPLSGLAGSLQKTRHFLEPERDFKQHVTSLSLQDFSTILSGEIDMPRSIFRMTFHSLPLELRAEFVRLHVNLFPQAEGRRRKFDYRQLADSLLTFFEERLDTGFALLRMVEDTYPSSIEGVPDLSELYFAPGDIQDVSDTDFVPLGSAVRELLSFGRDSITTRGLPALAREATQGESIALESLDSGFVANARAALEDAGRYQGRRTWPDSIF